MKGFLSKILEFIKKYDLIEEGDRILIALSGGPDSVFLLECLLKIREKFSLDLAVAHFNHLLREKEAFEDEEFSRKLAEERGLPFFFKREDVRKFSEKGKMSLEEAARRRRYLFLEETLKRWGGTKIATGHNLTDLVETVIFNLLRGAGPRGLRGIQPRRGNIIRPLLVVRKDEILEYLENNRIPYRVDRTNLDLTITRNFIRHRVLPLFKEIFENYDENIKRHSLIMGELVNYLEDEAKKHFNRLKRPSFPQDIIIRREELLRIPLPLRRFIYNLALELPFEHTEVIEELISKGRGEGDLRGLKVQVSQGEVRFTKGEVEWEDIELSMGKNTIKPLNLTITIEEVEERGRETRFTVYIPKNFVYPPLKLRHRKEGDVVELKGMKRKLKKILIDKKIPKWRREYIPVLEDRRGILWVVGVIKAYRGEGEGNFLKMEASKNEEGKFWIYDY